MVWVLTHNLPKTPIPRACRLPTYVLFAQGGYFASIATLPKGRPRGAVFHLLYACATAIFLIGLIKSRPQN